MNDRIVWKDSPLERKIRPTGRDEKIIKDEIEGFVHRLSSIQPSPFGGKRSRQEMQRDRVLAVVAEKENQVEYKVNRKNGRRVMPDQRIVAPRVSKTQDADLSSMLDEVGFDFGGLRESLAKLDGCRIVRVYTEEKYCENADKRSTHTVTWIVFVDFSMIL